MNTDYYRSDRSLSSRDVRWESQRPERESYSLSSSNQYRDFDRGGQKRYSKDDRAYEEQRIDRTGDSSSNNPQEYRTLCLSNLNPRIPDPTFKEAIYQEFKKFGDFNVKVVHAGDHRIAYVNFKYPGDARDAKYGRSNKLVMFDLPIRVDAVYHNKRRGDSPENVAYSGGRDQYYDSSRGKRDNGGGGGGGGGGGSTTTKDREFRSYDNRSTPRDGEQRREHKEHKFPHHLHHVQPEEDEKATRTLFVGNLDISIMEDELRTVFERYGVVEDTDIKRPAKGQGNAYAFLKFGNLDMAHRAKVDMSGRYIGKLQCKIGYGKVNPTNCVWIGGLGPWINTSTLEAELDRFGAINSIQWTEGKNYAYVLFDSQDAGQAACKQMRGYPLGGPDRRLRVDFADPAVMTSSGVVTERADHRPPSVVNSPEPVKPSEPWPDKNPIYSRSKSERSAHDRVDDFRPPENPPDDFYRQRRDDVDNVEGSDRWKQRREHGSDDPGYRTRQPADFVRSYSPARDRDHDNNVPPVKRQRTSGGGSYSDKPYYNREHHNNSNGNYGDRTERSEGSLFTTETLSRAQTIQDLAKSLPVVLSGALVLKTSAFSTRMHLVSGNVHLVDTLMRDQTTTEMCMLKITQRLRLDQPKLDDMARRVSMAGSQGHSILLAMPGSESALEEANAKVQHRPLRNLVSYLKQKDAAGVISLPPNAPKDREQGVLHAFPPCQFGHDLLKKRAPNLGLHTSKEDHLVVVVVGGSA